MIFPNVAAHIWLTVSIVSGIGALASIYMPSIIVRYKRQKSRKNFRHFWLHLQGIRAMQGIPKLERCHAEFIEYLKFPTSEMMGKRIAATQKFCPI